MRACAGRDVAARCARALRRGALLSFALGALPLGVAAQVVVGVTLRGADIAAGRGSTCEWSVTQLVESADPSAPDRLRRVSDSLVVSVVDTADAPVGSPAPLTVQIVGADSVYELAVGDTTTTFAVGVREIAARPVRVSRAQGSGAQALCVATPVPLLATARDLGVTHHDLFAGGEVSSALRSGAGAGSATGSLGLHSFVYRSADSPFRFPFGFLGSGNWLTRSAARLGYRVDLEELRAAITVAATGDTLFSPTRGSEYAQAVLAPLTATRGTLSSVSVMYSPQQRYGTAMTSLRGLRFATSASRSVWQGAIPSSVRDPTVTDTSARDTLAKDVTLFTGDVRWRWIFINHARDDDGNTFSFAMDGGLTFRGIAGDIVASGAENDALREATLGTSAKSFWGPVVGLYLTLRQVSAFAEVQRLSATGSKNGTRVESLEGWQPLIGFRFEAPIFTIRSQ